MGIVIKFIISCLVITSVWSQDHIYANKTLTITNGSVQFTKINGESIVLNNEKIDILSEDKAKGIPNYDPQNLYLSINGDNSKNYFYLDRAGFDQLILIGQFGSWIRKDFEKKSAEKRTPEAPPIKIQDMRVYEVNNSVSNIPIQELYTGKQAGLIKGSKFHIQISPHSSIIFVHTNDGLEQYTIVDHKELVEAFENGHITDLGDFEHHPPRFDQSVSKDRKTKSTKQFPQGPDSQNLQTPPKLEVTPTIVDQVVKEVDKTLNPKKIKCPPAQEVENDGIYDSCNNENNFYEDNISTLLTPTNLYEEDDAKYCILAGLKNSASIDFMARCKDGVEDPKPDLTNEDDPRYQACKSRAYVSFINKELTDMSNCLKNVTKQEMLPLINHESRFNANATNYNRRWNNSAKKNVRTSLSASGLLQSTQILYNNPEPIIRANLGRELFNPKKSAYCAQLTADMKADMEQDSFSKRNVCNRTETSKNIRHNLLLAMAQYSNLKDDAEKLIDRIDNHYLPTKDIFNEEEKKKMQIDLARLMHNRGGKKIEVLLEMFFYDLFKGGEPSSHRSRTEKQNGITYFDHKKYNVYESYPHGNPSIYKLWGRPNEFRSPVTHEQFSKYFSSYVFYEGSRVSVGKINRSEKDGETIGLRKIRNGTDNGTKQAHLEPNDDDLEAEGGTFLYKIECDQRRMNLDAQELAGNTNVDCGYPKSSKGRLDDIRGIVGWYGICKEDNRGTSSRRKCAAKNPETARDSNDSRRISDNSIQSLKSDDSILKLCDRESLRGLAANPLSEFYSSEPETYK